MNLTVWLQMFGLFSMNVYIERIQNGLLQTIQTMIPPAKALAMKNNLKRLPCNNVTLIVG